MSIEMEDRARMRRIDDAVIELVDNNLILDARGNKRALIRTILLHCASE